MAVAMHISWVQLLKVCDPYPLDTRLATQRNTPFVGDLDPAEPAGMFTLFVLRILLSGQGLRRDAPEG